MGFFCCHGLKKEFEIAVVNGPSVFEPLVFYCIFSAESMTILLLIDTDQGLCSLCVKHAVLSRAMSEGYNFRTSYPECDVRTSAALHVPCTIFLISSLQYVWRR